LKYWRIIISTSVKVVKLIFETDEYQNLIRFIWQTLCYFIVQYLSYQIIYYKRHYDDDDIHNENYFNTMTDYDVHGHLPRGKNINNDFLFLHLITNHLFLYVRANWNSLSKILNPQKFNVDQKCYFQSLHESLYKNCKFLIG
jgi:hypothetical protein